MDDYGIIGNSSCFVESEWDSHVKKDIYPIILVLKYGHSAQLFLSTLWTEPPWPFYLLGAMGAVLQLLALFLLLKWLMKLKNEKKDIEKFPWLGVSLFSLNWLKVVATACQCISLGCQTGFFRAGFQNGPREFIFLVFLLRKPLFFTEVLLLG